MIYRVYDYDIKIYGAIELSCAVQWPVISRELV